MAMIKCSECGKDISDKAPSCVGCGAPTAVAANQDKHFEAEKNCAAFKAALESTIDVKFAEIMRGKADSDRFLTYVDAQILSASVRNIFKNSLGVTPSQVEAACNLSDAVLAPSVAEKQRLIKAAVGAGGGAAGIAMVVAGVGSALGWGIGVIASVKAFFVGAAVAGPIGWAVAGVTLAGAAAFFATTNSKHKDSDQYIKVLKNASAKAVHAIWPEHGETLSKAVNRGPAT